MRNMNKDICIHCGKPISYKYYRDWNDNKVCLEHYEYINCCCCCFGFVDRDGRQVEHDRYVCSNCLRQEVSPDNMQSHIDFVYKLLYDKGFNDIQRDHIKIEIISKGQMQKLYSEVDAVGLHTGYSQVWNQNGRTGFKQNVYVLSHLHYIIFEGILAHELIHGWQLQQNIADSNGYDDDINRKTRSEGFAQLGTYIVMKKRYEEAKYLYEHSTSLDKREQALEIMRLCRYKLKNERNNDDPMYGVAFKKILERKNIVGWYQLIREARLDLLKKYV